jgi:hypothetical protein
MRPSRGPGDEIDEEEQLRLDLVGDGRAMTDGERRAHGNVVEMILKPAGSPTNKPEAEAAKPAPVAIAG